jgi:hypothetical protein
LNVQKIIEFVEIKIILLMKDISTDKKDLFINLLEIELFLLGTKIEILFYFKLEK